MSDLSIALIATAIVLVAAAVLSLSLARWAEEQHPSSGRFLTVNGVRLHYTDSGGSGAPVVLIHGNTVTFEDWQLSGVSAKAEWRYRVIAFDRPGFGYSERPRGRQAPKPILFNRRWCPLGSRRRSSSAIPSALSWRWRSLSAIPAWSGAS